MMPQFNYQLFKFVIFIYDWKRKGLSQVRETSHDLLPAENVMINVII